MLLNDSLTELLSVITHFIVNGRLFVTTNSVIIIADGSCCAISDEICSVVTGLLNINMIHSASIIAVSFWYRKDSKMNKDLLKFYRMRTIQEKGSLGVCRLQMTCILLFLLHIPSIVVFARTISPKFELESKINGFYQKGYASEFGLYGQNSFEGGVAYIICLQVTQILPSWAHFFLQLTWWHFHSAFFRILELRVIKYALIQI